METVIKLKPSELEIALQKLKMLIQGDENVEITITVKNPLKEEAYFKRLEKSIDDIENNRNLVSFSFNEFQEFSKSLVQ
jgi:hypothetical protein